MTFARHPLPEYEVQDLAGWSYTLTHDDIEDGRNKIGMRVTNPIYDVPLCQGCDQPIRDMRCDNCSVIFVLDARHIGNGRFQVAL